MAMDHSFDIVSEVDMQEVDNAVNQAMMEIRQRFDFKGSKSNIELDKGQGTMTFISDDDQKLKSVVDVLQSKFVKRKISLKSMNFGKVEQAAGDTVRQLVTIQQGVPTEKAKEMVKIIKNMKLKVTAEIQKDQVRVKGKKLDDLQTIIAKIKEHDFGLPLQFTNYR